MKSQIRSKRFFFSVNEFAELQKVTATTVRAACANWLEIAIAAPGAHLPVGWESMKWERMYIIYRAECRDKMRELFGRKAKFRDNPFLPA